MMEDQEFMEEIVSRFPGKDGIVRITREEQTQIAVAWGRVQQYKRMAENFQAELQLVRQELTRVERRYGELDREFREYREQIQAGGEF